jgi:hypothetical protein
MRHNVFLPTQSGASPAAARAARIGRSAVVASLLPLRLPLLTLRSPRRLAFLSRLFGLRERWVSSGRMLRRGWEGEGFARVGVRFVPWPSPPAASPPLSPRSPRCGLPRCLWCRRRTCLPAASTPAAHDTQRGGLPWRRGTAGAAGPPCAARAGAGPPAEGE